jgi:SAM-dependent methyltransferase
MDPTLDEIKQGWINAAKSKNFRNFIATDNNDEEAFRKTGKHNVEVFNDILKECNITIQDKDILELGCGAGRMTEFLIPFAKKLYATDISAEMGARLIERLGPLPSNVEFIQTFKDFAGIPDESIDIIMCAIVFQHIPEEAVESYFKDALRILRKGGSFIFQLPIRLEHETFVHHLEDDTTIMMKRWTLDEIITLLKKYNYKIIYTPESVYQNTFWKNFVVQK